MKKIFAGILTLSLAASMSLTAFAASKEGATEAGIDINGTFVAAGAPDTVVSADVKWDEMTFIYQDGDKVWDASKHEDVTIPGGWNNEPKNITVTNHSNEDIKAKISFAAETDGIIGNLSKAEILLDSAENTLPDAAPSETVQFGISGESITSDKKLGTITVTISANAPTCVSTADELAKAFTSGGRVRLNDDFTLTDSLILNSGTSSLNIDLNGKTVSSQAAGRAIQTYGSLTVRNGTIKSSAGGAFSLDGAYVAGDNASELYVENCTLTSEYIGLNVNESKVNVKDSTITSGEGYPAVMLSGSERSTFVLSGVIVINGKIEINNGGKVICLAGTFNFDPTEYVDAAVFTVTENSGSGTWTVAGK